MNNRILLQEAHNRNIINKKDVLWWQLGFEGRRLYNEEEFKKNLSKIEWDIESRIYKMNSESKCLLKQDFEVWQKKNVPILIKEVNIEGIILPCFVTVKPLSHEDGVIDGWKAAEIDKDSKLPIAAFYEPHIRGIVMDVTRDFLFWTPLCMGREPSFWGGAISFKIKDEKMTCLLNPVHPVKFYESLIRKQWTHGKRHNKREETFDCKKNNFEVVPYYEFDLERNHLMIYPSPLGKHELDFPIIIKSNPNLGKPEIVGAGYIDNYEGQSYVGYWELNNTELRQAKKTLIERLGKI